MPLLTTLGAASARAFGLTNGAAFSPSARVYTFGSGADTIPAGASAITIESWGAGANGQPGSSSLDGGGGGAGGYSRVTLSILSSNWGQTFNYVVTANGSTTVTNGTFTTAVSLADGAGTTGGHTGSGAGGTAAGGSINTTGASGLGGNAGGTGGAATVGLIGAYGAGGDGGIAPFGAGSSGQNGAAAFEYT